MRLVVFAILFMATSGIYGQKLRVDAVNDQFEMYRKTDHFDYLHEDLPDSCFTWVADYTISFDSILPGTLRSVFLELKDKSNRMGANSFRVTTSSIYSFGNEKSISIKSCWLRMEHREQNQELFRVPKVYIFGFLGYHRSIEGYQIKVNEEEFILKELRFRSYPLRKGQPFYIQQGSNIRGDYRNVSYEEKMQPKYFFFNKVTGALKNCWIDEYEQNFGEFLLRILEFDS